MGIHTAYYVGLVQSTEKEDCDSSGGRVSDPNLKAAYQWHAVTVLVLTVISSLITIFSVKEQEGVAI